MSHSLAEKRASLFASQPIGVLGELANLAPTFFNTSLQGKSQMMFSLRFSSLLEKRLQCAKHHGMTFSHEPLTALFTEREKTWKNTLHLRKSAVIGTP